MGAYFLSQPFPCIPSARKNIGGLLVFPPELEEKRVHGEPEPLWRSEVPGGSDVLRSWSQFPD